MAPVTFSGGAEASRVKRRIRKEPSRMRPERASPGWIAFTVIPIFAVSFAIDRVNPRIAALDEAYALLYAAPIFAEPWRDCRIR